MLHQLKSFLWFHPTESGEPGGQQLKGTRLEEQSKALKRWGQSQPEDPEMPCSLARGPGKGVRLRPLVPVFGQDKSNGSSLPWQVHEGAPLSVTQSLGPPKNTAAG